MRYGALLLFAVGCGVKGSTTTSDSAVEPPPPPPPTTDTVTTTTDPPVTFPPQDLTFLIDGDYAGAALALFEIDFDSFTPGAVVVSSAATASSVIVTVEQPDESALSPIDDSGETLAAFYLAGLFADDGDAVHEDGEVFTGISPAFVVFVLSGGNGLSLPLKLLGLNEGWNVLALDESGYPGDVFSTDAIPLVVPEPSLTATLSGTWSEPTTTTTPAPETWLGLVSANQFESGFTDVLYAALLEPEWSITVNGAPPESHRSVGVPELPDQSALEVPITFVDADASEGPSPYDEYPGGGACSPGGAPYVLLWLEQSDDLLQTLQVQANSGWMVVELPPYPEPASFLGAAVSDAVIGPCSL